jgi:exonuclease III
MLEARLNNLVKQEDVKQIIQTQKPMFICLQETKPAEFTSQLIIRCLGHEYADSYWYLPTDGTRGGVLLACRDRCYQFSNITINSYTISARVWDNRTNTHWTLTGVYGPQGEMDKRLFLSELRSLKLSAEPAWIILGDFNLIYRA